MPGRDYTHAFALLDQSLQGSTYLTSPTPPTLQRSYNFHGKLDSSLPATPKANGLPPFIDGQDLSLPPTPPATASRDLRHTPPLKNGVNGSHAAHGSGISTPTNAQSLPTPENTPPRLRDHLSPDTSPPFLAASSPYTESFKTAKEDQESTRSELELDRSPNITDLHNNVTEHRHGSSKAAKLRGLGMDVLGYGSRQVHALRHMADFSEADGTFNRGTGTHNDAEEYYPEEKSNAANNTNGIPILMRGLSLREDYRAASRAEQISSEQRLTRGDLSPVLEDSPIIGSLYDSDIKRLSGTSASSTVVEAVVIDHTPPPRKQKLRHVSKTDSLREGASPQLDRNSKAFEDSPLSPFAQPMTAHPHKLRRRDETIPVRPLTAPEEQNSDMEFSLFGNPRRIVSDPLKFSAISIEDMTPPPPSASPASLAADDFQDDASVARYDLTPLAGKSELLPSAPTPPADFPGSFEKYMTLDQPTDDSESARRQSFGPSLGWSENSLRYDRGASPWSLKSEATENFEISEAAAVQFSSHTNNSLLVVHHTASHDGLRHQIETVPPVIPSTANRAVVGALDSAVPIESANGYHAVDSPLRNPRAAPEPPIVTVIPPTPARELDGMYENDLSATSTTRQTSFLGRARRYSESFIQPFAGNLRRRTPSKTRSRSAARDEDDGRLHPEWQPKGYWGDGSGDEDATMDQLSDDPGATAGTGEGDSPEKWRRMGSIRGFLIGNTLGIQRGPTNKRRHVVNLPANKRRKPNPNRYSTTTKPITVRDSVKRSRSVKKIKKRRPAKSVFQGWREKMFERRWGREQKLRNEDRANLKSNIGWPTDVQDNARGYYGGPQEQRHD